jgi:hypothetical protein
MASAFVINLWLGGCSSGRLREIEIPKIPRQMMKLSNGIPRIFQIKKLFEAVEFLGDLRGNVRRY